MPPRDKTLDKMEQRATTKVPEGEPIVPHGPIATSKDIQEFKSAVEAMSYSVRFGMPSARTRPDESVVELTARCTVGELTDEYLHVWNNYTNRRGKFLTGEKQGEHVSLARMKRLSGSSSDRTFHQLELENYVESMRPTEEPIPGFMWRVFSSLPAPKVPQALRAVSPGPGPIPANLTMRENSYVARRGPDDPNQVREERIWIFRGTAEGVPRMEHSETDPHDFNDGFYATDNPRVAEQYARLRATPDNRPMVLRAPVARSELGRILDLGSGVAGQQWKAYLQISVHPKLPTYEELIRGANKNYWPIFEEFLRQTNRKLEDYDTIIGPEFVRGGWQYCIRNPDIQAKIAARIVEIDTTPVWVRVLDSNGQPLDVNVNDPVAGEENAQYVKERLEEQKAELRPEREAEMPGSAGPVAAPGMRVAAGIMLLIELARIALQLHEAIKSMPSAAQRKLEPPLRKASFWHEFGIHASVHAVVLRDGVKARGDPEAHAKGRILWGSTPKALERLDGDDVDFFLAFVDNFATPLEQANQLDKGLTSLLRYMRFLARGWRRAVEAILPPPQDLELPLARKHVWYVVAQRPESIGSTKLIEEYYSLEVVLGRIWKKLLEQETGAIAKRKWADVPAVSPLARFGANAFPIKTGKMLRFKASSDYGVFATVFYEGDATPRKWARKKDWGDIVPAFFQVGEDDVGGPFLIDKALLVTGANAETNAFLFGVLAEHDEDTLVAGYERTLSPDSRGAPQDWVNVPLVYVEADIVEGSAL